MKAKADEKGQEKTDNPAQVLRRSVNIRRLNEREQLMFSLKVSHLCRLSNLRSRLRSTVPTSQKKKGVLAFACLEP